MIMIGVMIDVCDLVWWRWWRKCGGRGQHVVGELCHLLSLLPRRLCNTVICNICLLICWTWKMHLLWASFM